MEFQAEKPKIHKLHNKMVSFYKILLTNYLRRTYVNATNVDMINPKHLNNYLLIEDIYLGPKAQLIMENESNQISASDIKSFRVRVLDYYITLCTNIRMKYHFKNAVLETISLIDPQVFLNNDKILLIIPLAKNDNINVLDMEYRELQNFVEISRFEKDDVETFWQQVSQVKSENKLLFGEISMCAKYMLSLAFVG
jgi:hypothetical protein